MLSVLASLNDITQRRLPTNLILQDTCVKQHLPLAKRNPVPEKPVKWITRKHAPPNQIVDPLRIEGFLCHRCAGGATMRKSGQRRGLNRSTCVVRFGVDVVGRRVRDEE